MKEDGSALTLGFASFFFGFALFAVDGVGGAAGCCDGEAGLVRCASAPPGAGGGAIAVLC